MRRRARVDGNHGEVIKRLRQLGISVADTSRLGEGFGDFLAGWRGVNGLFELKDPKKPPSQRKLTEDEVRFHAAWKGQIAVVESAEEVEEIMQKLTGGKP